jgi:hypothetical protein
MDAPEEGKAGEKLASGASGRALRGALKKTGVENLNACHRGYIIDRPC